MINYENLTKELIKEHVKISNIRNQINAITTALVGAIGEGHDVKLLSYEKKELEQLDLSSHREIFKETNKTVSELENFLSLKYDELEKLARFFKSQNSDMKKLFKMKPDAFLNQFFIIPTIKTFELQSTGVFQKLQSAAEEQNIKFNFISQESGLNVFFKTKEDLYKLQQIFCKLDIKNIDYNKYSLTLTKENEEYLAYLYL